MRACIFLFLTSFLLTQLFGYCFWEQKRYQAKEAAMTAIEEKKEAFISISVKKDKNSLSWNYSKEFLHNGQMYDIVSSQVGVDSITFVCYKDTYETWITREIENYINNLFGKSDPKKKQSSYGKYSAKKFIHFLYSWIVADSFQILEKNIFDYPTNYQFLILNKPFIPPEFRIGM